MFNIGSPELLVILVIALIVVGPRRLPEIGRTVGRALNEFRKVQDEVREMVRFDLSDEAVDPPTTAPVHTPNGEWKPAEPGGVAEPDAPGDGAQAADPRVAPDPHGDDPHRDGGHGATPQSDASRSAAE